MIRHQPTSLCPHTQTESSHSYKKHKKNPSHSTFNEMMSLFKTTNPQHLMLPPAPTRKRSQRFAQQEADEFLSSELEISFASTVSLNSPSKDNVPLTPDRDYAEPMDISPAPPSRNSYVDSAGRKSRPRAYTSGARLFGKDLSNNNTSLLPSPSLVLGSSNVSNTSTPGGEKFIQRCALPTEWLITMPSSETKVESNLAPSSPVDDAMDVDTSFSMSQSGVGPLAVSPEPRTAHPSSGGFNSLFYNTLSPRRSFESPLAHQGKKRRPVSPDPTLKSELNLYSSPGFPTSPSDAKVERMANGKPMLQGLGAPSLFSRCNRRPVVSASVKHSDVPQTSSLLSPPDHLETFVSRGLPVRRAFSAMLPPSLTSEQYSEESSFEGPDASSPAQAYTKRQQVRTLRRCDGSESLRAVTNPGVTIARESPGRLNSSPMSKFTAPGLGGFGDNEAHGKVLPCHKVTEDGLMRIKPETLNALIDGRYDSQIHDYHIIDCRFDYEYSGGHIPGAVNINTTLAVEELLLGPSLTKPKPSISGDSVRKTVLVFHCEFSAKRAPTFAKHLRARDRATNNMVYPKIHYPEIYILEGGYCAYFKKSGHRCDPPSYVRMDDPNHAMARREDLDQFRKVKFGRHKSYAYGENSTKSTSIPTSAPSQPQHSQQIQPKRNTASIASSAAQVFAAANAVRGRRTAHLTTLSEDSANTSVDGDDTDTDIGDSPCPPPTKTGLHKGKRTGRTSLARAETYGPSRLTLGQC